MRQSLFLDTQKMSLIADNSAWKKIYKNAKEKSHEDKLCQDWNINSTLGFL